MGPPEPPGDDSGCHILHADMDAFYASVEVRDRPELRGKPVIVGAAAGRGVVLSASYEARAYGVRSAMPMTRARRLCPHAEIVPPRHREYAAVSKQIMSIFRAVTPEVEPLSLDEAFLDVSGARRRLGPPAEIAAQIRADVRDRHGITCSAGVAPNKFLAKLASAQCKPDGLLVVPASGVLAFLHPLPVEALWGVGRTTARALARLGLRKVGDIAATPAATLRRELGAAAGDHLAALAQGHDSRPVVPDARGKTIGAEETFPEDVADPEMIRRELLRLSGRTARALRSGGYTARTVVVKLRRADFSTITRSRTLPEPTDLARQIYDTACELYAASGLGPRTPLRLVGVRAANLSSPRAAGTQLALGEPAGRWQDAEQAMDRVADRFGTGSVGPAALVRPRRPGPSAPDEG
jgi:DNA polymerase-4